MRVFSIAVLAAVLLAVAPAGAVTSAPRGMYNFRVVAVTHSSSSRKDDLPFYTGSSTSAWHLAPATRKAPNRISISFSPSLSMGLGYVNAKGVFTAEATSNRPNGHCSLSAPTGSTQYPGVAPGRFPLTVSSAFSPKGKVGVALGPGGDVYATLGNPYFPSECSTSVDGEPNPDTTSLISVAKSLFTHPNVTLRFAGSTSDKGITYHWSTTIKLKRVVKKH